jgi:hypothetical protein
VLALQTGVDLVSFWVFARRVLGTCPALVE